MKKRPKYPIRPHFERPPEEWRLACGDLITSWSPIDFTLNEIVVYLRNHLRHPPAVDEPYRYSDSPTGFKRRVAEIKINMRKIPELENELQALRPYLGRAKELAIIRHWIVHGHFKFQNCDGKYVLHMDGANSGSFFKERKFEVTEIYACSEELRGLSESIADIAKDIWFKT